MTDRAYQRFCTIVQNERDRMGRTVANDGMDYFEWLNAIVDMLDGKDFHEMGSEWVINVMHRINDEYPKYKNLEEIG